MSPFPAQQAHPGFPSSVPARYRVAFPVALLLGIFVWNCLRVSRDDAAAFDEPVHLVAGCSYLTSGAPNICTSSVRLTQLWLALPLLPMHPHLPQMTEPPGRFIL